MLIGEITNRRSIRKYKRAEIPLEVIRKVINAGRLAPSGKNKQPWRFLVYGKDAKQRLLIKMEEGIRRETDKEALLPMSGHGLPDARNTLRIMREAPILIMVLNPYGESPFEAVSVDARVTEIVDALSAGAAIENMLLQAEHYGLGTLWIANTFFAYPELMEEIGEKGQLLGAVALGYADEKPMPRPRKTLDELIEYRF